MSSHRYFTLAVSCLTIVTSSLSSKSGKILSRANLDAKTFHLVVKDPRTIFVPIFHGKSFVHVESHTYSPRYLNLDEIETNNSALYYLGFRENHYVAVDLTQPPTCLQLNDVKAGNLRSFADMLDDFSLSVLSYARGLVVWHNSTQYCSACGSPTLSHRLGSSRKCSNPECQKTHYPRIEPAVIMLISSSCNRYCLLGRKAVWPKGKYSTLAGFTEVGESLEESVLRETFEESGVLIDLNTVKYFASQPWPYPSSLMVGFHAIASQTGLPSILVDKDEMESISWFSKEDVLRGLQTGSISPDNEGIHFPGPSSLARKLIESWASAS